MYFPLAFQVLFLALLAGFGWAVNLLVLARAGVKIRPILQLAPHPSTLGGGGYTEDGPHQSVFRLVTVIGFVTAAGWLVCALVPSSRAQACVVVLTYMSVGCVLLMPQNRVCRTVRRQLMASLFRIVQPSMNSPIFLSDIIMADILTSCARIFADVYLVACHIAAAFYVVDPGGAGSDVGLLAMAVRSAQRKSMCTDAGIIGVLLMAAPYAFRLRQCMNEYLNTPPGSSDSRRHIANAVKYASSFPVIFLSAVQKKVAAKSATTDSDHADWVLEAAFAMWVASMAFNSLYSFYWDVAFDWDLVHFAGGWKLSNLIAPEQQPSSHRLANEYPASSESEAGERKPVLHVLSPAEALDRQDIMLPVPVSLEKPHVFPVLLRPKLCFSPPRLYYIAMVVDFLLRIVWMLKLSSYVNIDALAYGGFWLSVLEIYRRWQWTFLRIEKEAAAMD
ncbi:protein-ER retention protein [Coemansia sp. RSA 1200]|nr:protein-ER retention protein [Coemansia sp. RSA 1200]